MNLLFVLEDDRYLHAWYYQWSPGPIQGVWVLPVV